MKTGSFPYRREGIEIETIEELHNYFSSMEVKIARTRVYMGRDKIEGDFLLVIGIFGETMGERGLAINSYIRAWLQITRAREREKLILINEGNRGGIVGEGSRRRRKCAAHANSPPLPPPLSKPVSANPKNLHTDAALLLLFLFLSRSIQSLLSGAECPSTFCPSSTSK